MRVERLHVAEATAVRTADAIGMLVPVAWRSRLLRREKQQLLLLPELHCGPASSREVLAGGGRLLLCERAVHVEGESQSSMVRQRSEAVCRLTLATLVVDEPNYRPDPDPRRSPYVAGAADGRIAVLQPSHVGPVGQMQYNGDGHRSPGSLIAMSRHRQRAA